MSNTKNTGEKNKSQAAKTGKGIKVLISFIAVIVVLFIALTVYVNNYNSVYPNTYLGDSKISGMSKEEVYSFADQTFSENNIKSGTITLACKSNLTDLNIDDLGVKFDNVALSEKAINSGRKGNYILNTISYVKSLFSKTVLTPVLSYDHTLLSDKINQVAGEFESEPVGYTFTIETDSVTIFAPAKGLMVDKVAATQKIEEQICNSDFSAVELIPVEVEPEPLNFDEFYTWLTSDAKDAFYEKIDGVVVVHDSKPMCKVDREAVRTAISTLESSSASKTTIPAVVTQPENTFEKLNSILYKDVLGSYTTSFGSSSYSRANNVRLAASRINGTELMPGEEFSYDKAILPRTTANGYMEAGVYVGNRSETGMGGGICQPSSTLYAAALYANMEIIERHNHSLPVSYLPAGLDATIAEGYLDMRFKNSSDYPVKISATADGGVLTFKILGYNADNISVDIERSFSGGAHHVTRVVKQNGTEIKRERMTSSVYGVPEKDEEEKPEEEKPEEEKPQEGEEAEAPADTPPASSEGETVSPEAEAENTSPESAPVPAPEPAPVPEATPATPSVAE